jgi:hypothetical protein
MIIKQEKKTIDPIPHETGHTTPQSDGSLSPRLPHERDESSDSQSSEPDAVMQQAKKDLERGLVDTDRGPVMDKLYEEKVRPADGATPHRGKPG